MICASVDVSGPYLLSRLQCSATMSAGTRRPGASVTTVVVRSAKVVTDDRNDRHVRAPVRLPSRIGMQSIAVAGRMCSYGPWPVVCKGSDLVHPGREYW
jgi:hypothetical protein